MTAVFDTKRSAEEFGIELKLNLTQMINLISHNVQSTPGVFWDDKFNIYHKDPATNKEIKYTFKLLKFMNATITKEPEFSFNQKNDVLMTELNFGVNICYQMNAQMIVPKPNAKTFNLTSTLCGLLQRVSQEYKLVTSKGSLKPEPVYSDLNYEWIFEELQHSVNIDNYAPQIGKDITHYIQHNILEACKNCSSKVTSVIEEVQSQVINYRSTQFQNYFETKVQNQKMINYSGLSKDLNLVINMLSSSPYSDESQIYVNMTANLYPKPVSLL